MYNQGTTATRTAPYQYTGRGQLGEQRDWNNQTTGSAYDAARRLVAVTNGLGHTTRYGLDGQGQPRQMTDAAGHVTTYTYAGFGRVRTKVWPNQSRETVTST